MRRTAGAEMANPLVDVPGSKVMSCSTPSEGDVTLAKAKQLQDVSPESTSARVISTIDSRMGDWWT